MGLLNGMFLIGQVDPWDEPAPVPPPSRPMTFSDLQRSLHDYTTGNSDDNGFRNGILILLAVVAVTTLVLHLRQRYRTAGPPDSASRLGRELARVVRFPLGTRFMLRWVARTTGVPFASLLLSQGLFDRSVSQWSSQPTFSVVRRWGRMRLTRLRLILFNDLP